MRLPFPERIPLRYAIYFAALLWTAQLLQGTPAPFSLCCFLFIIIATLAFNLAGGFSRPSGGYVFFYAVLAVILGLVWKAYLGEPADSNLTRPLLSIQVELGGITAMFGAVFISRKLTGNRAFLGNLITDANLRSAALGCMIVGLSLTLILTIFPYTNGSVLSALAQLNQFLPIAIILGVLYQIRKSGGTTSINSIVLISGAAILFAGLIGFTKQGIFTPMLCWLVIAASQRYRVSGYQIIGFILAVGLMVYYLVPYSQYGRNFLLRGSLTESKQEAFSKNIDVAFSLLSDLGSVREQYEQNAKAEQTLSTGPAYFDKPQGLFDRLQMLSMDDAIINETEQSGKFGSWPIIYYFENLVPHFLWPGKPVIGIGNLYAHELGMLGDEDVTTGISFSPVGEAFHIERWVGIFIVAPVLWIMLFTLFDSLCGDVRKSPWGLLAIVLFAHVAPEQMLGGIVYMLWYGAIGIIFAALAAAYVMAILGSIFTGRGRSGFRPSGPVRAIPRRLPPAVQPSQSSGQ